MTAANLRALLERHDWNAEQAALAIGRPPGWVRWAISRLGLRREYDRRRLHGPRLGSSTATVKGKRHG